MAVGLCITFDSNYFFIGSVTCLGLVVRAAAAEGLASELPAR